MTSFGAEVESNFDSFDSQWFRDLTDSSSLLWREREVYLRSYKRITSIQGWQSVIEPKISPDSFGYFVEAHNDALMSHVLARMGSWRLALKSLRSLTENSMKCFYYKDHPIELELSLSSKHKIGFSEMITYFQSHPLISDILPSLSSIEKIKSEYATLSQAVHGSNVRFRMTSTSLTPQFWKTDIALLGQWESREKSIIHALNLMFIALMRDEIKGTKAPSARKAISLGVPTRKFPDIATKYGIILRV